MDKDLDIIEELLEVSGEINVKYFPKIMLEIAYFGNNKEE